MTRPSVILTMEDLIQRVQKMPGGTKMESPAVRGLLVSFARSVNHVTQQWNPPEDITEIDQVVKAALDLGLLEESKEGIVSITGLGQRVKRLISQIFANYNTMV